MSMIKSQNLKSVDFTKAQKSRYLKSKTLFFLQIKKFINYASKATLWQKQFVGEVTFNVSIENFQTIYRTDFYTQLSHKKRAYFERY